MSFARLFWDFDNVIKSFDLRDRWMDAKKKLDGGNVFANTFTEKLLKDLK